MATTHATEEALGPRLVAPVGGMPVDGSAVTFTWIEAPGATDYRVEIATDEAFTAVIYSLQTGRTTVLTLLEMLPQDGSAFFWRVQAQTASGWQPWSKTEQFIGRTEQHEIAFRARQEGTASPSTAQAPSVGATIEGAAPYQVGHTSKGTMAMFLAMMLVSFGLLFAFLAYVVNAAQ